MKAVYEYLGPVKSFDNILNNQWLATTVAKSSKQAINNLSYRYKKEKGYIPSKKIYLDPTCLRLVKFIDDEGYYGTIEDYIEGRVDY